RKGARGHTKLSTAPGKVPNATEAAELRAVMSGVTAIAGAGGSDGLVRNLDGAPAQMEGLKLPVVNSDTFPLADTNDTTFPTDCAGFSPKRKTAAQIANYAAYL